MMAEDQLRVALAGGGTGGHLFPALNLGKAMEEKWNAKLLFFGTRRGIEKEIIPRHGYELVFLPVQGFQRRLTAKNLLFPLNLLRSLSLSKKALRRFKPHLVIGTGGYVMGPVLKSAKKLNIPVVIQEQNSYPGVTTRLLAKDADYLFLAYEEAKQYLPDNVPAMVTGNPIRLKMTEGDKEEDLKKFGLEPGRLTLLVVGGSQGAESINRAVMEVIREGLFADRVQWLWQTGVKHFEKWSQEVQRMKIKNVRLVPFISEMVGAYRASDLVICRAGAMTLSELTAMGRPAVLIPFPYAAANHQYKNALALANRGAAKVIVDDEKLVENLKRIFKELMESPQKIEEMARKMSALHQKDSVDRILSVIERILEQRGWKFGFENEHI